MRHVKYFDETEDTKKKESSAVMLKQEKKIAKAGERSNIRSHQLPTIGATS